MRETYEDWANEDMPEEDLKLFEDMRGNYISEEEKLFFETLEYREKQEWTTQGDVILSNKDNDKDIHMLRICFNEYSVIRVYSNRRTTDGVYTSSLYELLHTKMSAFKQEPADITFWEWLRQINYKNLRYDVNRD